MNVVNSDRTTMAIHHQKHFRRHAQNGSSRYMNWMDQRWKSYLLTNNSATSLPYYRLPALAAAFDELPKIPFHPTCIPVPPEYLRVTEKRTRNGIFNTNKCKESNTKDTKSRFRRCRTRFTKQQLQSLEKVFSEVQYPSVSIREKVAAETKLSEARVQKDAASEKRAIAVQLFVETHHKAMKRPYHTYTYLEQFFFQAILSRNLHQVAIAMTSNNFSLVSRKNFSKFQRMGLFISLRYNQDGILGFVKRIRNGV
ncbi:homeobox protein aristaless-like 4 [Trichonephila clavipes]|nr:homeobox protein aristaless-like 4 [Trichonephila clavipes]